MDSSAQGVEAQVAKLEQKINSSNLPPDLLEKAKGMVEVLKVSIKQGGSYTNFESISNYLNTISQLPFETVTEEVLDIHNAQQILNKNHYGLLQVKDIILEYLSSIILNIKGDHPEVGRAPILCLVGLVGTGKTTLAYSIAEALGRNFERIPLGGMGDVRTLRGQSRAFADAEPGQIIKKLIHAKAKNCVILLDELDRVTEDSRADIMGALVELLDPEQNRAFTDHYVDYPVDLSRVLFISTANNTTNISTAVMDRLEIVQMPSYSDEEKMVIGRDYLFPKISKETGLVEKTVVIDENVWALIIRPLGYDSGIRSLERTIQGICRKIARLIVEGKLEQNAIMTISPQNIKEFLPT